MTTPTKRGVSAVKANLLNPALTSHFEVEIPFSAVPFMNGELDSSDQLKLLLNCSEVSLPGSQIATIDINNDYTGVTERHGYRRMFDESMDFTFYVDAGNYLPIKFFEKWMKGVMNEQEGPAKSKSYTYRARYPDSYMADQGLKIRKFEKSFDQNESGILEYEFIRSWPKAISSMPITYDSSSLLKTTVSMTYLRYIVNNLDQNISSQSTRPPIAGRGRGQPNENPFINFAVDALGDFADQHLPGAGGIARELIGGLF